VLFSPWANLAPVTAEESSYVRCWHLADITSNSRMSAFDPKQTCRSLPLAA
jgi:hypothetical protein